MPLIQDYNKLFEYTDNIKKIILNGNIVWPVEKPTIGPDYTEPFYSENTTDQTESVTFYRYNNYAPTFDVYYSLDKGSTWNFCGSTAESFTYRNPPHTKVWFCAETTRWTTQRTYPGISIRYCKIVGGNSMSLLYGRNFNGTETTFPGNNYSLSYLFNGNTSLVDASELLLPATVLVDSCYRSMFGSTLDNTGACVSLVKGPTLPDATRASSDTRHMFRDCTSLTEVKCFFTTSEPVNCDGWLLGVTSTGTFYKKAGVTWSTGSSGIPSGWTVVEV